MTVNSKNDYAIMRETSNQIMISAGGSKTHSPPWEKKKI